MHQGEMMHRALLADLSAIPEISVITTHDSRLPMLDLPQSALVIPIHGKFAQRFNDCVQAADAVWLVAPEFGGILEGLSRKVLRRKRILLGSRPGAVRVASSKLLTVRTLANAGIPVVDTYTPEEALPGKIEAWVVKPDNGAGCLNTRIFSGARKALAWIETNGDDGYVLMSNGLRRPLTVPSGSTSGIKVIGDFKVERCNIGVVTLAFTESIQLEPVGTGFTDPMILRPVIIIREIALVTDRDCDKDEDEHEIDRR